MPNLAQPDTGSQVLWALSPGSILVSWVLDIQSHRTAQTAGVQVVLSHYSVDIQGVSEQEGMCGQKDSSESSPQQLHPGV